MAITINGSGTISGITAGGLPDGVITADDLAAGAITSGALPAGSVLQVVQGSTSTQVILTTSTYTDTGLTASITPTSASSKILVLVNQSTKTSRDNDFQYFGIRLLRDSTVIHYPPETGADLPYDVSIGAGGSTDIRVDHLYTISKLDSPNTTSSITYKTMGAVGLTTNNGELRFQQAGGGGGSPHPGGGTSTIILMEIAG